MNSTAHTLLRVNKLFWLRLKETVGHSKSTTVLAIVAPKKSPTPLNLELLIGLFHLPLRIMRQVLV